MSLHIVTQVHFTGLT